MEQEPTLFDVEASTPEVILDDKAFNARMWEKLNEQLHTAEELRAKTGIYKVLPTPELMPRIKAHFDNTVGLITAALSGVSEETRNAVLFDYAAALSGGYDYTVTLEQMQEALRAVKPSKAFQIDRYGLYWCVFLQYSRTLRVYDEYRRKMIDTDTRKIPAQDKALYMAEVMSVKNADYFQAFEYLKNKGYATPLDFVGCTTSDVRAFLDKAQEWADVAAYGSFCVLVRGAYAGADEDIQKILPPPLFKYGQTGAGKWAEHRFEEIQKHLNQYALRVADLIDAETQAEREKAKAEAEAAEEKLTEPIRMPERVGLILSRDVFISPQGAAGRDILPIQVAINEYMKKHPEFVGNLTPRTVEKAIEGVNMLPRWHRVAPANGLYSYKTSINEIARGAGMELANEDERKALLQSLLLLNGLYVVVWEPKGRKALRVLSVRSFGLDGKIAGEIELDIPAEVIKGRPNLIDAVGFEKMRQEAKGLWQNHLRNQLLSKGQKEEQALLNEVFGYDTMLVEATHGTGDTTTYAAEVKAAREYIRKNKSRDRKKLVAQLDKYAEMGAITYTCTTNAKGETIYKWKAGKLLRPQNTPTTEEPDEQ